MPKTGLVGAALAIALCTFTTAPASGTPMATQLADFTVGGTRPVTVHVPTGYRADRPTPLLIMLHGWGSSGAQHERYLELAPVADERGVLYAYPNGTRDSHSDRFWNATDACCDFDRRGVNDLAYLTNLVNQIASIANVDRHRIYFMGHSNGGFMSHAMACKRAGMVAAIVSYAGAAPKDWSDCQPTARVAILEIHGDADRVVDWDGGRLTPEPGQKWLAPFPSVGQTAALWLKRNGCSPDLVRLSYRLNVAAGISGPSGPAEAIVKQSRGCSPGGHVEVWRVPGGGHTFALSVRFQNLVFDFLLAHPKP
jgi:polyhydroxybutyrate depolymerase